MNIHSTIRLPASTAEREHATENAGIAIRPMSWRDLRAISLLQKQSFGPLLGYGLPTLVLLMLAPDVKLLIAWDDERPAGCAIGDRQGKQSRVVNLCVAPTHRRCGIATILIRRLEEQLPVGDIVLMVQVENDAARALYINEGYRESGLTRGYYGLGRDGLWMRKSRGSDAI